MEIHMACKVHGSCTNKNERVEAMETGMNVAEVMSATSENLKIIFQNDGRAGKFGINLSSEIDFLIKEAAKCDHFASDVIYNINSLMEAVEAGNTHFEWFGFRDMGVDHDTYVKARVNNPSVHGSIDHIYRSIYLVVVEKWNEYYDDGIRVTTFEVFKKEEEPNEGNV